MGKVNTNKNERIFEKLAMKVTAFSGTTPALIAAILIVLVWAISGPFFGYSEAWQLIINTGTTILTFLMVFVIQRTQNKESLSTQLKLNEIIASIEGASNRLVDAEDLSESELKVLKSHYLTLSKLFKKEIDLRSSHSVEEAELRHKKKFNKKKHQS